MEIQQCWQHYLEAEKLMEQGYWPEAHRLYSNVLAELPIHIQQAVHDEDIRPCQFSCLLSGLRDAAVAQSGIFNQQGQHNSAFSVLNQSYALLQFVSLESCQLIERTSALIEKQSEDILRHIEIFCRAQSSDHWLNEFEHMRKSHQRFSLLKAIPAVNQSSQLLS